MLGRLPFAASVRRLTTPFLGVSCLAFVLACGDAAPVDPTEQSVAALEEEIIGDQGPGWDRAAADPTLAPSFRIDTRALAEAPARVVLDYTWFGQPNGYWCGPGSMRMALSTRLETPPSQDKLAKFMGTTTAGTARADTIRALNEFLTPRTPYESIPVDTVPTQDQRDLLKQTVVSRLSSGWPVIANVLSGWRPPGYPTGKIGHFVAVVGYDQSGDKVLIADPAAAGSAGPRWEDVPKTYWISMQNLGTWVGGRGYSG